jgi:hypothetical protein
LKGKQKTLGGMPQMIEHLASMCNALSSNPSTIKKERLLKAKREKCQLTYKAKYIRITSDPPAETLKYRKVWDDIFQALRVNNCQQEYYIQLNYP